MPTANDLIHAAIGELDEDEAYLEHYGVLGMKWGVRRDQKALDREAGRSAKKEAKQAKKEAKQAKKLDEADTKWARENATTRQYFKVYNEAASRFNQEISSINSKPEYANADFNKPSPLREKYYKELSSTMEKHLNDASKSIIGESPTGSQFVFTYDVTEGMPQARYTPKDELKHEDDGSIKLIVKSDGKGRILSVNFPSLMAHSLIDEVLDEDDFLAHYGVLGMKWGVRRDQATLDRAAGRVPRKTKRNAKKDAKEFARAKAFYGEGAGNRRKAIKTKVESRKSKSEAYAKLFEEALASQDMEKHVAKAQGERRRKDTSKAVGKTARGVKNLALGTGAPVGVGAAAIYAMYKSGLLDMPIEAIKDILKHDGIETEDDFLAHYGILGMKWGVRRSRDELARNAGREPSKKKPKRSEEKEAKKQNKAIKKERKEAANSRRTISDQELKSRVERLKMEKQLNDLTFEDSHPILKELLDTIEPIADRTNKGMGEYLLRVILTDEEWDPKKLDQHLKPKK